MSLFQETISLSNERKESFLEMCLRYTDFCTDAPRAYSVGMCLKVLGHAMGFDSINNIQPADVHHNLYTLLIGPSGTRRKTTIQDLYKYMYPLEHSIEEENSPEQFIVSMSEDSNRTQWLGEFTGLLKGISSGGYMARFAEEYNHLYGCPQVYRRKLREKKDEKSTFEIRKAYLSLSSTTTEEVLEKFLNVEIFEGGLLPRWLIVNGESTPRPRGRKKKEASELSEKIRTILKSIYDMEDKNVIFNLSDEALELYNKYETELYQKYSKIKQFVARYLNYIVSFADILMVSEAIGEAVEKKIDISKVVKLVDLVKLVSVVKLVTDGMLFDGDAKNLIEEKTSEHFTNFILYT